MNRLDGGVLGLFPSFGAVGGVERSGRIAWEGIARASSGNNHVICYGKKTNADGLRPGGTLHHRSTRMTAALLAGSRTWPVRLIVAWHMGMLKLLPLIRTQDSKTALFLHGVEAWRPASPAVNKLLGRVDLFLTVSDFTWKSFLEFHPHLQSAEHRTVALGIGEPIAAEQVAPPADPPCVLMIGRIARSEAYKGHDAVIAALRQVLDRIPGAKLRMIGPCEMRESLLTLADKHGVRHAVEIAGPVSESEKTRYLAECRCMALPSRGEGFGLVYLEAMRMGRPCVVSTLDAGREVVCAGEVGDAGGLAVNPSDSDGLASALVRLMTPGKEWDGWSAASRRRYESRYTEAQFHERLIAALTVLP